MALEDGYWIALSRKRDELHHMTFRAADAQNPEAMAASRRRGTENGIRKALAARYGPKTVDPITEMDAFDFIRWLREKENSGQ